MDVPARRVPCVLGARHATVGKGVGARCSPKDSRKGSLPDPRNAAQRGPAKGAPHGARDNAARLIRAVAASIFDLVVSKGCEPWYHPRFK